MWPENNTAVQNELEMSGTLEELNQIKQYLLHTYFPDGGNRIENRALALSDKDWEKDRKWAWEILLREKDLSLTDEEVYKLKIIAHGTLRTRMWELLKNVKERFESTLAKFLDAQWRGHNQDTPPLKTPRI